MAKEDAEKKDRSEKKSIKDANAKEPTSNIDEDILRSETRARRMCTSPTRYEIFSDQPFTRDLHQYILSSNLSQYIAENRWPPILSTYLSDTSIKLAEDVEDRIGELKQENRKLREELIERKQALEKKEIETGELEKGITHLKKNQEEIAQQQRLQYLLYKVHPAAWEKLKSEEAFRKLFYRDTPCPMFIMSIDIRKSTELMLNAKDPKNYQGFVITLCTQLKQIILENYGVFDKFTGDGILAFFPQFYSGEDAAYCAIKAAAECHAFFSDHYNRNRSCFTVILKDIGLGIGIDFGETQLVNMQDWLTVIGTPVVYACRLSGAEAGHTLLNQQAYDEASKRFGEFITVQEYDQPFKHQGSVIAYSVSLTGKTPEIRPPDWLKETTPSKK
jgi:class 3 adenylate cyclase